MATKTTSLAVCFHTSPEVRLQNLELVCRREKITEVVSKDDLNYVTRFMYLNFNVTAPGFRHRLLTCIKYLLIQLRGSGYALFRECVGGESDILKLYKEFVQWLVEFCFYSLRLRGGHSRRENALRALELIYSSVSEDKLRSVYVSTWKLNEYWTRKNVDALLLALADSYEVNQSLSLKLLKSVVPDELFSQERVSTLLATAFSWCRSSRSQYPDIAVYYFLLVVNKSSECENGNDEEWRRWSFSSRKEQNCFQVCDRILVILEERTNAIELDLLNAAVEGPPWGALKSVFFVMKEVDWSSSVLCDQASVSHWRSLIQRLLRICQRLSLVVSPIVNSASPEGYLPPAAPAVDYDTDENDDLLTTTGQAVLVCCWRTQKEVGAVYGLLASLQRPSALLTFDELVSIGEYFIIQLTECKHRGAFECAYSSFAGICASVRNASTTNEAWRQLPRTWLRRIVDGLVSLAERKGNENSGGINYCATRRSAGVPLLVQAVLATEPKDSKSGRGSALFYDTLQVLVRILFQEEPGDSNDVTTAKVHSLNILRALLKESKLGVSCLTPAWLSMIAQADLLLFTHRSWAVRNSATLLFSAWMVRVFGVPRIRDEVSPKNRMLIVDFDSMCPDLLDFLLHLLRRYTDARTRRSTAPFQEMILFPILSILSRLYSSSRSNARLNAFTPFLLDTLAHCPIFTVRRSAINALCSIIGEEGTANNSKSESAVDIARKLIVSNGQNVSQNALHGIFMLVEHQGHTNASDFRDIALSTDKFLKFCPLNLAALLRIVSLLDSNASLISAAFTNATAVVNDDNGISRFWPICEEIILGPLASFLLTLVWKGDHEQEGISSSTSTTTTITSLFETNARFRREFYKQWRKAMMTMQNSEGCRRRELIALGNKLCESSPLVWDDIIGGHADLKLRERACKFCLCQDQWPSDKDRRREKTGALLVFYQNSTMGVRRYVLQLACRLYCSTRPYEIDGDDDILDTLLGKLDAASKPACCSDDRWMVVCCLGYLDKRLLELRPVVSIIFIRLLSDAEDVIREEAANLCSRLLNLDDSIQPTLALFTLISGLLLVATASGAGNGRLEFCAYLSEIADDLDDMLGRNSSEGRIFDKNETNSNLEPLLLSEWLRLCCNAAGKSTPTTVMQPSLSPDSDVLRALDACLDVDALRKFDATSSSTLETDCNNELIWSQMLRLAVKGVQD